MEIHSRRRKAEGDFGSHEPNDEAKLLSTHTSRRTAGVVNRSTHSWHTYHFQADKPSFTWRRAHKLDIV